MRSAILRRQGGPAPHPPSPTILTAGAIGADSPFPRRFAISDPLRAEGLPLEIIETVIAIAFGLFLLMFFVPNYSDQRVGKKCSRHESAVWVCRRNLNVVGDGSCS